MISTYRVSRNHHSLQDSIPRLSVSHPRRRRSGYSVGAERYETSVHADETRESDLGIRLNLEPAVAQMTFASKGIDRRGVVRPDLLLFCIVAYAHPDVVVACSAGILLSGGKESRAG